MKTLEIILSSLILYLAAGYFYTVTFRCPEKKMALLWPYYIIKGICDNLNEKDGGERNS